MRRRDFVVRLGGAALAWSLPAIAQSPDRVRRIGVLLGWAESDPESQLRLAAFKLGLAAHGWNEGRNLRIETRWTGGDIARATAFAKEIVATAPDVIVSATTPATAAIRRETRSIPTVFAVVSDPVGSGFVTTLSHPGGNTTGFINLESSLAEKWLQLLKEIAPRIKRAAVIYNPKTAPYVDYYLQPLKAVAPRLGVVPIAAPVGSETDIERVIAELGRTAGSGLVVMTDSFMFIHRKHIISLAARYKIPAIYYTLAQVEDGGLIAYGVDLVDLFRRAASYVDKILRGAKPADLPVEQPTKFELAINAKTAKGLGIKIPQSILVRADKVIE